MRVTTAADGAKAISLLEDAAALADRPFDLGVLDLHMPVR